MSDETTKPLPEAEHLRCLAEAVERERVGGTWRVQHVAAVLDLGRATVYRTAWLLRLRKRRGGTRGVYWVPSEVRAGQDRASIAPRSRVRRIA